MIENAVVELGFIYKLFYIQTAFFVWYVHIIRGVRLGKIIMNGGDVRFWSSSSSSASPLETDEDLTQRTVAWRTDRVHRVHSFWVIFSGGVTVMWLSWRLFLSSFSC